MKDRSSLRGVLVTGAPGSGKTRLALELIEGCRWGRSRLISDDVVTAWAEDGRIVADAPERLCGLVELRGTGLARIEPSGPTPLFAVIALEDRGRLPPERRVHPLGPDGPALPLFAWQGRAAGLLTFLRSVASGHSATAGHDAVSPGTGTP
nr:hypothetical protein [Parvularcula dongshanensis]